MRQFKFKLTIGNTNATMDSISKIWIIRKVSKEVGDLESYYCEILQFISAWI